MTVDDLIAKIRAAIDEDERIAKAAKEVADGYVGDVVPDGGPQGWTDLHGLRQDPDRTLAMVAAHREILELHERSENYPHECTECGDFGDCGCARGSEDWPCPTLLALAKGYGIEVTD